MVNGTPTTNPISEKHTPSYNTSIIKNPSVHFETFAKIRKPYKPKKPSTKKISKKQRKRHQPKKPANTKQYKKTAKETHIKKKKTT